MIEKFDQLGRKFLKILLFPLVWFFSIIKIPPNIITLLGTLLSCGVAFIFAKGYIILGGMGIIISGLFDAIDGMVARKRKMVSIAGAFIDSVMDRYSDLLVLMGIAYYSITISDMLLFISTLTLMLGSVVVPYTRAKAESLGERCSVGFMPRHFRLIFLSLGALLDYPVFRWFVLAISILTNLTAIHRIIYSYIKLRNK